MRHRNHTGGGPGTNQYRVRGRAKPTAADVAVPEIHRVQTVAQGDVPGLGPAIYVDTAETRQAQAPTLSRRQWRHLSRSTTPDVHLLLALRADCPSEILHHLTAQQADYQARTAALSNPACPLDRLHYSSSHDSPVAAREAIASNSHCPVSLLDQLARDDRFMVRRAVAGNQNCSADAAAVLARDGHDLVAMALARNPRCPPELLIDMVTDSRRPELRQAVWDNPALPDLVRAILALGH